MFVPKKMFFTKGVGRHREKLASFELALRDAGIAPYNLVRVSSIFPPHCKIVSRKQGVPLLKDGQIAFVVLADSATNEPNRLVAASIGVAIPADRRKYGYLSEHHSYGETEKVAGDYTEDLAAIMLSTTLGLDVDMSLKWDERKEIWKVGGEIVRTTAMTQTAIGDKKGWWTTAVSAAVLIP